MAPILDTKWTPVCKFVGAVLLIVLLYITITCPCPHLFCCHLSVVWMCVIGFVAIILLCNGLRWDGCPATTKTTGGVDAAATSANGEIDLNNITLQNVFTPSQPIPMFSAAMP